MPSKDGKGRSLWDILTGRNKKDMTPLELQYHNPLGAKIGNTMAFDHEAEISGINFVVERISVYETRQGGRKDYHTDYHLKGISLDMDRPVRFRLRLVPDTDAHNKIGCEVQLLYHYHEMEWDEGFHDGVLGDTSGEFHVTQDDEGNSLESPRKYWRVDEVTRPYDARVTTLADSNGDGTVDEGELHHNDVQYWDYARLTDNDSGQEFKEYLVVEMNKATKYFTFLRGHVIEAFQVTVI